MDSVKCSIWTNGKTGWGVKVLGGPRVRRTHFRAESSPITVEIDGVGYSFNVDKKSFWTKTCGELIGKPIRDWKTLHRLKSGDHVSLQILEPYRRFRLELLSETDTKL